MKRSLNLFPVIVIGLLLILINWYVQQGMFSLFNYPWFKPAYNISVIAILTGFFVALFRMPQKGTDLFFKIAVHIFITVLVAEIIFSAVNLLGDLFRFLTAVIGNQHSNNAFLPAKIPFFLWLALASFFGVIVLFIDGIVRGKYAYRIVHQTLSFDNLPASFDGFKIVQISDVHAGSFDNKKAVQKGINLIKKQKADLFVFTGDLVNNKASEIEPWMSYFNQIKAPYGQFSVLGNHDYGDYVKWESAESKALNLQQLKSYHQQIGFKLLLDEHVTIKKDNEQIILAGVENWGIGFGERGNLDKSLRGTSQTDFKVLLSHDPSHFDAQVKTHPANINLTLSGHTHGMQFGIEAFGIKWSPVKYRYKHWAGLKKENNRFLYINRGFGFLGFSGRVGIWPEITVIELKQS